MPAHDAQCPIFEGKIGKSTQRKDETMKQRYSNLIEQSGLTIFNNLLFIFLDFFKFSFVAIMYASTHFVSLAI